LGRIHGLVLQAADRAAPLERSLDQLARHLAVISVSVCGLSLIAGLLRGFGLLGATRSALSLAVTSIPDGFPTITAATLALGIRNLRRRHVTVHRLEAVEALGTVQTICLDKTGTITMNQIAATAIYTGMRRIEVHAERFTVGGVPINPLEDEGLLRLMRIGALCSDSETRRGESNEWVFSGPPMDNALLHLAVNAGVDVPGLRRIHPVVAVRRGGTRRKYMMSVHLREEASGDAGGLVAVKGRSPGVLARCGWQIQEGRKVRLGEEERRQILHEVDRLSKNAMRVLGLAYREIDSPRGLPEEDPADWIWLGAVGFTDPIRPGAREIIDAFRRAGISTVMITGDRTDAAYSVAKESGIAGQDAVEILDSTHLRHIEPGVLSGLTERAHVFARLSPAEKRQVVLALQRRGKVVAMTGDGVNDAPALKAADIGIAMGKGGTALAREVADVILEDDRLETMIVAVRQGRAIHDNLRKSTRYLLAATAGEVITRFVGAMLDFRMPTPFFWMNLLLPALALAMEPPEPDVMNRPPRPAEKPILGSDDFKKIALQGGALSLGALAAYGYGLARYGPGARAGTLAFMGMSMAQPLHALSARSERASFFREKITGGESPVPVNSYLPLSVGGTLLLQSAALFLPGARSLLGLAPVSLLDGAVIAGSAALPLLINEAAKKSAPTPAAPGEVMIAGPAVVAPSPL
jgi:Ca2+-transporting ATPase